MGPGGRRFMKAPLRSQDRHRPAPKALSLEDIFCLPGVRTVNNGYLIKWISRTFLLTRLSWTLRRQKVVVREWFDGRISARFNGKELEIKEVEAFRPKPPKHVPPVTHPWKRGPVVLGLRENMT